MSTMPISNKKRDMIIKKLHSLTNEQLKYVIEEAKKILKIREKIFTSSISKDKIILQGSCSELAVKLKYKNKDRILLMIVDSDSSEFTKIINLYKEFEDDAENLSIEGYDGGHIDFFKQWLEENVSNNTGFIDNDTKRISEKILKGGIKFEIDEKGG